MKRGTKGRFCWEHQQSKSRVDYFPSLPAFEDVGEDVVPPWPGAHGLIFLPVLLSLMGPSMDHGEVTEVVEIVSNAEALESNSEHSPKGPKAAKEVA